MDEKALQIVRTYIKTPATTEADFATYIVWKCKTLQNWKYLIASTLHDGMYYELTFNGDRDEWYLDAYKKTENLCIPN